MGEAGIDNRTRHAVATSNFENADLGLNALLVGGRGTTSGPRSSVSKVTAPLNSCARKPARKVEGG